MEGGGREGGRGKRNIRNRRNEWCEGGERG